MELKYELLFGAKVSEIQVCFKQCIFHKLSEEFRVLMPLPSEGREAVAPSSPAKGSWLQASLGHRDDQGLVNGEWPGAPGGISPMLLGCQSGPWGAAVNLHW